MERGERYVEFIYTRLFERARKKLLDDDALRIIELMLAQRPRRGTVERGTGGVRKVRFGLKGSGKSGGARVIYYFDEPDERIYMLLVYSKSKQATMTDEERGRVRKLVERLKS